MDEDMLGFAHGLTSAVAATSVWEILRTMLTGWVLLMTGALASGLIFHLIHHHHQKLVRQYRRRSPHHAKFRAGVSIARKR